MIFLPIRSHLERRFNLGSSSRTLLKSGAPHITHASFHRSGPDYRRWWSWRYTTWQDAVVFILQGAFVVANMWSTTPCLDLQGILSLNVFQPTL